MAKADARVEPLGHDVRERLVEREVDADVRVLGEKSRKDRLEDIGVPGAQHRQAQETRWATAQLAERLERLVDLVERRL